MYQSGLRHYLSFTRALQIFPDPISTEKETLFVAYLGAQGPSVSTIQSYMSALRNTRLLTDPTLKDPSFNSPYMDMLIRGIKPHHSQTSSGPQMIRLPITPSIMRRIKQALSTQSKKYHNLLIWAACCTGFFGFLRCGEFLVPDGTEFNQATHLSLEVISLAKTSP